MYQTGKIYNEQAFSCPKRLEALGIMGPNSGTLIPLKHYISMLSRGLRGGSQWGPHYPERRQFLWTADVISSNLDRDGPSFQIVLRRIKFIIFVNYYIN